MNALILVDIQNDFLPGGALGVPCGDEVIPAANELIESADIVVATQDWHPRDHGSFAGNHEGSSPGDLVSLAGLEQRLWPDHCIQGTPGAEFASGLNTDAIEAIFRKGTSRDIDSYSGFFDNGHRKSTGLAGYLCEREVTGVTICGLATDYCVKFTALDSIAAGFETTLVPAACRGVDLTPGDVDRAIAAMEAAGVKIER